MTRRHDRAPSRPDSQARLGECNVCAAKAGNSQMAESIALGCSDQGLPTGDR